MLHSIFYVIIFLLALVLSNVINKVFPKVALPLIQVMLGLLLGFLGAAEVLNVEPEVFLGFIIAPLLFRESEEADVKHIFKHTKTILVLILPLVFITALGLGWLAHSLYLTLPLAACFALGASLAPTDAVAVGALSENFSFPKRITSILKGEGLLNDASGIIAFQIAVAALMTGEFSLPHATVDLVISAFGGAAIGLFLVWAKTLAIRLLEDVDAKDITGYLILDLMIPLAAFLIADLFNVSTIIAVVVAGVMQANGLKRTTLFDAQVTKVKETIWDMLMFILNSVVFLFLGIELYQLVLPLLTSPDYSDTWLLFMVISLTIGLFLLRFIVLLLYYWITSIVKKQSFQLYWNDILLLTFAGSKGTVSIATILLIPRTAGLAHSLLIFLVASVTALSFLVGMFILPFFAAKKLDVINNMAKISILTEVVAELRKDMEVAKSREGYNVAIDNYQERIQRLIIEQESSNTSVDFNELQLLIIRLEAEGLENARKNDEISMRTYRTYQRYIHSLEQSVVHDVVSSIQFVSVVAFRVLHLLVSRILHIDLTLRKVQANVDLRRDEITHLYFKNTELILQALENLESVYDAQLIDFLQAERLRSAEYVAQGDYIARLLHRTQPNNLREMMRAYYLERKVIFEYESAGEITAREARLLRQNVNVLEDYSMANDHRTLLFDFLEKRKK
ncbi:cation:proton antiporter [Lactococcus nasutitermitis]|uniref:Cation:proton antiporter n=1 Tax=Lactococcus nasutitermitis TaxID=1652957 RepID=A0ABV9J9E1_9LACT|nr:sodium:proton antiporter [Lactococcus nasutitermitis]